jgi:cysteine desulfurase
MYAEKGNHIITVTTEHKATIDSAKSLEKHGCEITFLPVDTFAMVDVEAVRAAITPKTILISVMHANNEVGTIQPIAELGKLAKEKGILFHVDAAQTVGKEIIDVNASWKSICCRFRATKFMGLKGLVLVCSPLQSACTLSTYHSRWRSRARHALGNVECPGIVGLGMACEIARLDIAKDRRYASGGLRQSVSSRKICEALDEVHLNGHPEKRLYNNLNLSFAYVEGGALMRWV